MTDNDKPKLCRDCRWFGGQVIRIPSPVLSDRVDNKYTGSCSHPALVERICGTSVDALTERLGSLCGWDGKLWEAPPSAEPERKGDKQ